MGVIEARDEVRCPTWRNYHGELAARIGLVWFPNLAFLQGLYILKLPSFSRPFLLGSYEDSPVC